MVTQKDGSVRLRLVRAGDLGNRARSVFSYAGFLLWNQRMPSRNSEFQRALGTDKLAYRIPIYEIKHG
jgi:hypothetical protein